MLSLLVAWALLPVMAWVLRLLVAWALLSVMAWALRLLVAWVLRLLVAWGLALQVASRRRVVRILRLLVAWVLRLLVAWVVLRLGKGCPHRRRDLKVPRRSGWPEGRERQKGERYVLCGEEMTEDR